MYFSNIFLKFQVFCLCFSPRTGSVVLGGLGIIMAVLMIVPPCLILESHEYYFNEYIREQKTYGGKSYNLFSKANIALKNRAESFFNHILFAKISQVYLGTMHNTIV